MGTASATDAHHESLSFEVTLVKGQEPPATGFCSLTGYSDKDGFKLALQAETDLLPRVSTPALLAHSASWDNSAHIHRSPSHSKAPHR